MYIERVAPDEQDSIPAVTHNASGGEIRETFAQCASSWVVVVRKGVVIGALREDEVVGDIELAASLLRRQARGAPHDQGEGVLWLGWAEASQSARRLAA